jgi:ribonuclease HI
MKMMYKQCAFLYIIKMNLALSPVAKHIIRFNPYLNISLMELYFDGCAKGNPGLGGCGAVLYNDGAEIWNSCKFLGHRITNNEAEYSGLLIGLQHLVEMGCCDPVIIKGDSRLVIKQMRGEFKVGSPNLIPLHAQCMELSKKIEHIVFTHVYRTENKRADELANLSVEHLLGSRRSVPT